jgi:hypothetical protein
MAAASTVRRPQGSKNGYCSLIQYAINGHDFLERIVTGDDVVSLITLQRQTVQTWSGNIPPLQSKTFKMGKSAGRVISPVCWDRKGVLLVDFM